MVASAMGATPLGAARRVAGSGERCLQDGGLSSARRPSPAGVPLDDQPLSRGQSVNADRSAGHGRAVVAPPAPSLCVRGRPSPPSAGASTRQIPPRSNGRSWRRRCPLVAPGPASAAGRSPTPAGTSWTPSATSRAPAASGTRCRSTSHPRHWSSTTSPPGPATAPWPASTHLARTGPPNRRPQPPASAALVDSQSVRAAETVGQASRG